MNADAVIARTIEQGTCDCETCQHDPAKRAIHLATNVIIALCAHGWRVIPADKTRRQRSDHTMRPAIKHHHAVAYDVPVAITGVPCHIGPWYTNKAQAIESGQAALDAGHGFWFTIETRWFTPHTET